MCILCDLNFQEKWEIRLTSQKSWLFKERNFPTVSGSRNVPYLASNDSAVEWSLPEGKADAGWLQNIDGHG